MGDKKNKVNVLIDGKTYNLVGVENENYIRKVGDYINKKYDEIKKMEFASRLNMQDISILASINIADDLFKSIMKNEEVEGKLNNLLQQNKLLKERIEKINIELLRYKKGKK